MEHTEGKEENMKEKKGMNIKGKQLLKLKKK